MKYYKEYIDWNEASGRYEKAMIDFMINEKFTDEQKEAIRQFYITSFNAIVGDGFEDVIPLDALKSVMNDLVKAGRTGDAKTLDDLFILYNLHRDIDIDAIEDGEFDDEWEELA